VDERCSFKVSGQSEDEPHVSKQGQVILTQRHRGIAFLPLPTNHYFVSISIFLKKVKNCDIECLLFKQMREESKYKKRADTVRLYINYWEFKAFSYSFRKIAPSSLWRRSSSLFFFLPC